LLSCRLDWGKDDSHTLATVHRDGHDAVRAACRELDAHGYYRRAVMRVADGTLRTEVVVSNTPMSDEDAVHTGDGFSGVGPGPDFPASAEPAPVEPTPVDQAPKEEVATTENTLPPQPPRTAGG